jgi:hypothetical protein
VFRDVDHRRHDRHAPAQLQQPVAVRCVVAVVSPDAALTGRAADPGRTQAPDDRAVDGLAVVPGRL